LRHLVLYGNYDLLLDGKNRVVCPSEVRKQLVPETDGDAFFLVTGTDGRLWLYPERHYANLVSQAPSELTPDEDVLAYDRMNLGLASRIEWDKQWRLQLPERELKRAGIGREITLVGNRDHLELWNRAEWEAERLALEARRAVLFEKIRRQRQEPSQ
jgi:MraZ protein